jgi:protein required for attachment to host cells
MQKTWIVTANTNLAKIYSTKHQDGHWHLELIQALDHPESKLKGVDLTTDGPGKYHARGAHGKFEATTNPKSHEQDIFALEIVKFLETKRNNNDYEALIIVADPHFHGLIDKHLHHHEHVNHLVKKHVQKNYLDASESELLALLRPS